jgi:hypothetical protein
MAIATQGIRVAPLGAHEAGLEGANLEVIINQREGAVTEATVDTAQTLQLFNVPANVHLVELVKMELIEPFEDASDAAHNTTLVEVGDGGDTDRLLASTQLNRNGTEVYNKAGTGTKYNYTADDTVDILFAAPASGKALADLDRGKLRLLFRLTDSRDNGQP